MGRSGIKVIDFGSSCYEHQQLYSYIQSRFYRAPEVILGAHYGMPIDIWSFGCTVVELLTGYPLFPGEDEGDQMACIIEMFGVPDKKFLSTCKRERYFITSRGVPRYCVQSTDDRGVTVIAGGYSKRGRFRGPPLSRDLIAALISAGATEAANDVQLVDFLRRCLSINPDDRMTAPDAIRHDWLRRRPQNNNPSKATAGTSTRSSRHTQQ